MHTKLAKKLEAKSNESILEWPEVSTGIPRTSVLDLVLFNTFIKSLNAGIVCFLIKLADDPTELSCKHCKMREEFRGLR